MEADAGMDTGCGQAGDRYNFGTAPIVGTEESSEIDKCPPNYLSPKQILREYNLERQYKSDPRP
jgi:hypothetical protein